MKSKGPLITLLAGVVVAGVLLLLSMNAASKKDTTNTAADAKVGAAKTSAPPTTAAANVKATYAGKVDGGAATIAISMKNGKAIAYVCDGNVTEAWLQGTAEAGKISLTGPDGSLTGTYDKGKASGTVKAGKKQWTFTAPAVAPPSGLYRAAADVRKAKVVGGWIVLADGSQVGILTENGKPAPAPKLDVTGLTATIDGTSITAFEVDGTAL